jgi:hypothetical protein
VAIEAFFQSLKSGVKKMKRVMRIVVRRPGEAPISIAQFKKLSFAERLKTKWFGCSQKVLVIVPGNNVQKIEIKEVKENGNKTSGSSGKHDINADKSNSL